MTMLVNLIRSYAKRFDDKKYPSDVYYHLIEQVRHASTPAELGAALSQALAWKDGKIRRDPTGPYVAQASGTRFSIASVKPNTLSDRHEKILSSEEFFEWAIKVRNLNYFELGLVLELNRFGLWSTVVIPVFVLHCLRPQIYPISDRWVQLAYNLLELDQEASLDTKVKVTAEAYAAYQAWWLRLLGEAGLGPMTAQLNQLKEIDAGLWALGKRAMAIAEEMAQEGRIEDGEFQENNTLVQAQGTDSDEFKRRAVAIRNSGKTQRQAMIDAAKELGITLKPSYTNYPGSHFERWRKQGFE